MAKITTGELYNEWQLINEKLEQLNNKVDDVIENGAINTQSVGNIVELFNEEVEVSAGAFVGVTPNFENTNFTKVFVQALLTNHMSMRLDYKCEKGIAILYNILAMTKTLMLV